MQQLDLHKVRIGNTSIALRKLALLGPRALGSREPCAWSITSAYIIYTYVSV